MTSFPAPVPGFPKTGGSRRNRLALRTDGMTFFRMPAFSWAAMLTSAVLVLTTPVFAAGLVLLLMDQHFGGNFFQAQGGQLVWQHTVWLFGRPEIYLLTLPGLGAACEIVATHNRRPLERHVGEDLSRQVGGAETVARVPQAVEDAAVLGRAEERSEARGGADRPAPGARTCSAAVARSWPESARRPGLPERMPRFEFRWRRDVRSKPSPGAITPDPWFPHGARARPLFAPAEHDRVTYRLRRFRCPCWHARTLPRTVVRKRRAPCCVLCRVSVPAIVMAAVAARHPVVPTGSIAESHGRAVGCAASEGR